MSEPPQPEVIAITLPYGGPILEFKSVSDLFLWWQRQLPLWKKLRVGQGAAYEHAKRVYEEVFNLIDPSQSHFNHLNVTKVQELIEKSGLVFTDTARGEFIEKLSTTPTIPSGHHADATASALALLSNLPISTEHGRFTPGAASGMFAALAFLQGGPSAIPFWGRGFESLYEKYASHIRDLEAVPEEVATAKQNFENATKDLQRQSGISIDEFTNIQKQQIQSFVDSERILHAESLAKIEAWGEALKTKLAAGEPIKHWSERLSNSRTSAISLFVAFVVLSGLAIWGVWSSFSNFTSEVNKAINGQVASIGSSPPQVSVVVSVIAVEVAKSATVLTICFWILRTVLRACLSNYHIWQDAAERVAMTQTYLALIAENAAAHDGDRKIVLEALFRRAGTGIYREDATPPTIGVHIAKPVSPPSKDE